VRPAAKGESIHVGVNAVDPRHYGVRLDDSTSREKDAKTMEKIAQGEGFQTSHLFTQAATRGALENAVKGAASRLKTGDFFLLTVSAHGTLAPYVFGAPDEAEDSAWCLYDGWFYDDENHELWARFAAGVRILLVSDSCNTGTIHALTGRQLPHSGLPRKIARKIVKDHPTFYANIRRALLVERTSVQAKVQTLVACRDDESAYIYPNRNGVFTAVLREVWAEGTFRGTYTTFIDQIRPKVQKVARESGPQTPLSMTDGVGDFSGERPFTI